MTWSGSGPMGERLKSRVCDQILFSVLKHAILNLPEEGKIKEGRQKFGGGGISEEAFAERYRTRIVCVMYTDYRILSDHPFYWRGQEHPVICV